jgi:hypothetical protein
LLWLVIIQVITYTITIISGNIKIQGATVSLRSNVSPLAATIALILGANKADWSSTYVFPWFYERSLLQYSIDAKQ